MVDVSGLVARVQDEGLQRCGELADEFVNAARSFAPRRTGAGVDSIEVTSIGASGQGFTATVEVGEEYMVFQNQGTGVYGPSGQPITPKHGNVLVFDGIGGIVFARSVRGSEPTHFWERTIDNWPRIVRGLG